MHSLVVVFALTIAASPSAAPPDKETAILGDWCAGSENALHEEFSLSVEDGERTFRSWLHHRPAESGTWELRGKTFVIHGRSGEHYIYTVLTLTPKKLVLRQGKEKPETYVREGCREFEPPPRNK